VIPFESKFSHEAPSTPEEQLREKHFFKDDSLKERIPKLTEAFAWMLLQHRLKPRIAEPEKVIAATDRYRMNNDYLHQFMNQVIVDDPTGTVASADLYCRYKEWLDEGLPGVRAPPLMEFLEYFQKKWGNHGADGSWKGRRIRYDSGGGRVGADPSALM
jgi:phage/plasmid-associated DNA primase